MKKIYRLEDLDCATCAMKMEDAVRKLEGVEGASVNFMAQKMVVDIKDDSDEDSVRKAIAKACRRVEPDCKVIG
jgi:cation transport ATPase